MTSSQQPQQSPSERRRPPWFLIIAAIVIVVVGIAIAIIARGGAVEQVSLGYDGPTQAVASASR